MNSSDELPRGDDPATAVDLIANLGEGYGAWSFNTDAELLAIVSSGNVACGFHAGDPTVIRLAVASAHRNGVTIGAHVGYPHLQGFDRRNLDMGHQELVDATPYQRSAIAGLARVEGTTLRYVKPHGALYNRVVRDRRQAEPVAEAIALFDPALAVVSLPGSALHAAADDRGPRTLRRCLQTAPTSPPASPRRAPAPMRSCMIPIRSPSGAPDGAGP